VSATVTLAAGTALTVTTVVVVLVSLVAVIVEVPAVTPVTTPDALIVATPVADDAQVIVRPVSVLPLASVNVGVNCAVCPTMMLGVSGTIAIAATGA
jgi:hypothetical protein